VIWSRGDDCVCPESPPCDTQSTSAGAREHPAASAPITAIHDDRRTRDLDMMPLV
jgi:hypothetical protein